MFIKKGSVEMSLDRIDSHTLGQSCWILTIIKSNSLSFHRRNGSEFLQEIYVTPHFVLCPVRPPALHHCTRRSSPPTVLTSQQSDAADPNLSWSACSSPHLVPTLEAGPKKTHTHTHTKNEKKIQENIKRVMCEATSEPRNLSVQRIADCIWGSLQENPSKWK